MGFLKNLVNAKVSGNVGSLNFRKRGSGVVVAERSYTNSSKGSGATVSQRIQRSRLSNIVNFFKVIKAIEARAWENKTGYTSDFNMFTKNNLATSPVFLTKQESAAGASVIAPYVVSKGNLMALSQSFADSKFNFGVAVTPNMAIGAATIADLSKAIIANNSDINNGDKISLAVLKDNYAIVAGLQVPQASCNYFEFTLDENNTLACTTLANFAAMNFSVDENGNWFAGIACDAAFAIHSRQTSGVLETSSQSIIIKEETAIFTKYTSDSQKQLAMDSYGYQSDVLLTPGATTDTAEIATASVSSIKYDDTTLANGGTITAGNQLVIEGTKLATNNITVSVNGTSYVPQSSSATKQIYTLSTAGTLHIYINGTLRYTCTIEGGTSSQTITQITLGSETYSKQANNLTRTAGVTDVLRVKGSNLGEISVTGATMDGAAGSATERTANITYPSAGSAWTIMIGGEVICAGTSSSGGGADYD